VASLIIVIHQIFSLLKILSNFQSAEILKTELSRIELSLFYEQELLALLSTKQNGQKENTKLPTI